MNNRFKVYFNFTTVHGSRFKGRNGDIEIETDNSSDQVHKDLEQIKRLCAAGVHQNKPKWNIFLIDITNIQQL
jgi:hypothetical protein